MYPWYTRPSEKLTKGTEAYKEWMDRVAKRKIERPDLSEEDIEYLLEIDDERAKLRQKK